MDGRQAEPMLTNVLISLVTLLVLALVLALLAGRFRQQKYLDHARFIAGYRFPPVLVRKYGEAHPALDALQVRRVFEGLRQYFLACLAAQRTSIAPSVGMPSRAVDDAWHDFLLMTRDYQAFCRQAFGKYLHHTPEASMGTSMRDALANTLHQFKRPLPGGVAWATLGTVPLLFAMDRELGYPDGFHHDAETLGTLEAARERLASQRALQGGDGGAGAAGGGGCCGGGSGGGCCSGGGCGGGGCGS